LKPLSHFRVYPHYSVRDVLNVITTGASKIAVVVDEHDNLIGSITDGDIRRGFLQGLQLNDNIESIIRKDPMVCSVNESKENMINRAVSQKIFQIIIIEDDKVLGIEELDELLKKDEKTNQVVLMVGGLGSRLHPLTKETPKPMLKVGKKPILETIIENFSNYGFKNFILSVSYLSHVIEEYFGDGSKFGVKIRYIHEEKRMGTAGSLFLMKKYLKEPFFVMNGDLLTSVNFQNLHDFHMQNSAKATMCVRKYEFTIPYGVVNIKNQDIVSIDEKPVHQTFVNAGIYILDPMLLENIPENSFFDMPTLFEEQIGKVKVLSFPIHEYWLDIGHMRDFEKANNEYGSVFL
jgi:dTDP-glucose pyrophosphorylase